MKKFKKHQFTIGTTIMLVGIVGMYFTAPDWVAYLSALIMGISIVEMR